MRVSLRVVCMHTTVLHSRLLKELNEVVWQRDNMGKWNSHVIPQFCLSLPKYSRTLTKSQRIDSVSPVIGVPPTLWEGAGKLWSGPNVSSRRLRKRKLKDPASASEKMRVGFYLRLRVITNSGLRSQRGNFSFLKHNPHAELFLTIPLDLIVSVRVSKGIFNACHRTNFTRAYLPFLASKNITHGETKSKGSRSLNKRWTKRESSRLHRGSGF